MNSRERMLKELGTTENRIQRWPRIHSPKYLSVYKQFHTISSLKVPEQTLLSQYIIMLCGWCQLVLMERQAEKCGNKTGKGPG